MLFVPLTCHQLTTLCNLNDRVSTKTLILPYVDKLPDSRASLASIFHHTRTRVKLVQRRSLRVVFVWRLRSLSLRLVRT